MAESARRVDLRLTIRAGAPYYALAGELARKFAEHEGASPEAAVGLGRAVETLAERVSGGRADAAIDLTIAAGEAMLTATLASGNNKEQTTCALAR